MGLRDRFRSRTARQLAGPAGFYRRRIGRGSNRANRPNVKAAVAATEVRPGQAAADIGFGGGVGLGLLLERVGPRGHVHGVELSENDDRASQASLPRGVLGRDLALHAGIFGDLPLEDGSLDGLITTNTVYFIEDLEAAFREIARVLRPTGRAVVGVADPELMASVPVTAYGFRIRPVKEVLELLRNSGFADVRHERVGEGDRTFHLLVASVGGSSPHP